jgi:hypothetical protein
VARAACGGCQPRVSSGVRCRSFHSWYHDPSTDPLASALVICLYLALVCWLAAPAVNDYSIVDRLWCACGPARGGGAGAGSCAFPPTRSPGLAWPGLCRLTQVHHAVRLRLALCLQGGLR